MRKLIRLCDMCAGEGVVRIAAGDYRYSATKPKFDACATHLKQADGYGALVSKFGTPGDVNPADFSQ
jgi:hypothetical protein